MNTPNHATDEQIEELVELEALPTTTPVETIYCRRIGCALAYWSGDRTVSATTADRLVRNGKARIVRVDGGVAS